MSAITCVYMYVYMCVYVIKHIYSSTRSSCSFIHSITNNGKYEKLNFHEKSPSPLTFMTPTLIIRGNDTFTNLFFFSFLLPRKSNYVFFLEYHIFILWIIRIYRFVELDIFRYIQWRKQSIWFSYCTYEHVHKLMFVGRNAITCAYTPIIIYIYTIYIWLLV